jgi:hypothetical protein
MPDTVATPDSLYEYQVVAEDQDADTLVYRLITELEFLAIDSTSGLIQGTPGGADEGEHEVTVEVDDGNGGLASQTFTLIVEPASAIGNFSNQIPQEYVVSQNYPNPFNPETSIRFGLPRATNVRIELYNILGAKVATIIDDYRAAGYHVIRFDASQLASGTYIYRIVAGNFQQVKKMILLR